MPGDAMTTVEIDAVQTSDENRPTTTLSSSDAGAHIYFQSAVVIIGVLGAAANALILYALVASKQHKKQLLIFNQNVFDFCSCLLLVITYTLELCNIRLTGMLGYWLCMIILSENLLWCSNNGSVINLLSLTVQRYLKVVHPKLSKKLLRKWVIYSVIAFSWMSCVTYNTALAFSTSAVIDGVCYSTIFWKSQAAAVAHSIWYFISFVATVVFILVFCYWRILVVVRRQASVMAGHSGPASSTGQVTHSNQIQSNVIKTMILVSAFYVIAWMPINLYYMILIVNTNVKYYESVYSVATFISFLYISTNPFIYATKFDPVKRILVGLIPCKRAPQAGGSTEMT